MNYKECNIKGFERLYHIYENGDIYSLRRHKMLTAALNTASNTLYAYYYVTLSGAFKMRLPVHRLVAHHWIAPIIGVDTKLEVNHKDLNKSNNHYLNLELMTHRDNMLHARQHNNWQSGRIPGYKASVNTRQLMALSKYKKVVMYDDTQYFMYDSIEEFCLQNNTYRKKFNRIVNSHKSFNGFKLRYLK